MDVPSLSLLGIIVVMAVLTQLQIVLTTRHTKEVIIVSAQETVNAIVSQLGKAKGEIVDRISDLQADLDAAGLADKVDLTALVEAAQALDDVVADAPVEEAPVEEVPVEDAAPTADA